MSASREKSKRKELANAPEQNVSATPAKKEMSKGLKTPLGVIIAVVVVAVIVFFYMVTSGFFATHTTAAVVGEHKLSPAMVNFFYKDAYSYTMNQWGEMASYLLDTETPLDEQVYNEETGESWADYFVQNGLTTAAQMYALYDDALANGFQLSAEQEDNLDVQVDNMALYASMYGYTSGDAFITANYGEGCNSKNYREYLLVNTIAETYSNTVGESFNYTAEEIAAEYAANPEEYDGVTYRSFLFSPSNYTVHDHAEDEEHTEEQTAAEEAAAMDAARAAAEAMLAAVTGADEAAFHAQCIENAPESTVAYYEEDADYSLRQNIRKSGLSEAQSEWLFDTARVAGDVTSIESESTITVLYYVSRDDHDRNMPNVRHILFPVDDSTDVEADAAAKQNADDALAAYLAGEQTEAAFEALGEQYLTDGTASEAALYEDIYPGQMVSVFENWCYDSARQSGDTGIVQSTYGYHVMYYVGTGDSNVRDYMVEDALRTADFSAWQEGVVGEAAYEIVSLKHVSK